LTPPIQPMLARAAKAVPDADGWLFEPKWDGFRCLVFRDGDDIYLQSRSGKPLRRYFPDIIDALTEALPPRVVLDGELIVAEGNRLDFDSLSERIHPSADRVNALAEALPAEYVAFDLLALDAANAMGEPMSIRRDVLRRLDFTTDRIHLTPATEDPSIAREWFEIFEGAGLDGVVGKKRDGRYTPGARSMIKVKHTRTADCVLAGLRWHADAEPGTLVGSLLLGVYDDGGTLHHIGVVGAFPMARRRQLAEELMPLTRGGEVDHPWLGTDAQDGRRLPGGVNRWRGTESPWVPLRRERVARSNTNTPRARTRRGCGTTRSSCAGAPTAPRKPAATTSSRNRSPTTCVRCSTGTSASSPGNSRPGVRIFRERPPRIIHPMAARPATAISAVDTRLWRCSRTATRSPSQSTGDGKRRAGSRSR
jgi:hypothetical protein